MNDSNGLLEFLIGYCIGILLGWVFWLLYEAIAAVVSIIGSLLIAIHRFIWNIARWPRSTYPAVDTFNPIPALIAIATLSASLYYIVFWEWEISIILSIFTFLGYFYRKILKYLFVDGLLGLFTEKQNSYHNNHGNYYTSNYTRQNRPPSKPTNYSHYSTPPSNNTDYIDVRAVPDDDQSAITPPRRRRIIRERKPVNE